MTSNIELSNLLDDWGAGRIKCSADALADRITAQFTASLAAAHGLQARAERAEAALRKIADGMTDSDAPDVMKLEPADFRSGMWSWSQRVARAALAAVPS